MFSVTKNKKATNLKSVTILQYDFFNHDNFDEDDPKTIIHVRLMAWCNRQKQLKTCKNEISKDVIAVTWYPTKCQNWRMSQDGKKK